MYFYRLFLIVVIAVGGVNVNAWSLSRSTPRSSQFTSSTNDDGTSLSSRRDVILRTIQTTAFIIGTSTIATTSLPQISRADVSDGNSLPDGAKQFGNVIRAKADLQTIKKRAATSASEMDKKEWDNVSGFLRRIYGLSDDMKSIANTMDDAKKKQAFEYTDSIKKLSKAADVPAQNQNGSDFVTYADKIDSVLGDFLALLQDVPDEL